MIIINYPQNRNSKSIRKSYVGEQIGYLKVLKYIERIENEKEIREYECHCDACNSEVIMSHNSLRIAKSHMIAEHKCPSCGCRKSIGVKLWNNANAKDLLGMTFGNLTVIEKADVMLVGTDNKKRQFWKCRCNCGTITYVATGDLTSGNTKSCGCISSYGEESVAKYLTENNVTFQKEYSFYDLCTNKGNQLKFDFAIFNSEKQLICLIEYQGIQHYKDFGYFGKLEREETDQKKIDYCSKNNITLFHIPYDSNIQEELDKILHYIHENTVPSKQNVV